MCYMFNNEGIANTSYVFSPYENFFSVKCRYFFFVFAITLCLNVFKFFNCLVFRLVHKAKMCPEILKNVCLEVLLSTCTNPVYIDQTFKDKLSALDLGKLLFTTSSKIIFSGFG